MLSLAAAQRFDYLLLANRENLENAQPAFSAI